MEIATIKIYRNGNHLVDVTVRRNHHMSIVYNAVGERHNIQSFVFMYGDRVIEYNDTCMTLGAQGNIRFDIMLL